MKIELHDKRIIENPDAATINRLFFELNDPGDFMILSDDRLGEIRTAGPLDGKFLVQCDLSSISGAFRGERDNVHLAEVQSKFLAFLNGETAWKETMSNRKPTLSEAIRSPFLFILLALIGLVIYFLIRG
jgi:hypothetical protein